MLNNRLRNIVITLLLVMITSLLCSCVNFAVLQDKPTGTWATEDKTLIIDFDTFNGVFYENADKPLYLFLGYLPVPDEISIITTNTEYNTEFFYGDYHEYKDRIILCKKNNKSDIKYTLYPADELAGLVTSESSAPVDTTTSNSYVG